jgi:hypothetical protein
MRARKDGPCPRGCKELSDHYDSGSCSVCDGWVESRCLRCRWYITECPCASSSGCDKISASQRRAIALKKRRKP